MSIIAEALKKVKKDRDRVRYPEKNIVPPKKTTESSPQSYSSSLFFRGEGARPPKGRPSRNRTLITSVALLLLVFAFLAVSNIFFAPSREVANVRTKIITDDTGVDIEAEGYSDLKREIVIIERKEGIIDKVSGALKGMSAKDEFSASFSLNGIVYDSVDPWAIINNEVVRAGDELDGARIISIAPRRVVLLFRNEKFDLVAR